MGRLNNDEEESRTFGRSFRVEDKLANKLYRLSEKTSVDTPLNASSHLVENVGFMQDQQKAFAIISN
jgi:hypothetical protein